MARNIAHAAILRGPLLGLAWIAVFAQALFFAAPLLLVLWLSLQGAPDGPATITSTAWLSVLGSVEARAALLNSMLLAALSALITTLIATPLAFLIAIRRRFLGRLLLGFIILMWFSDPGIRILGWMQAFKDLALIDFIPINMLGGFSAELIASVHAWLPLAVLCLAAGFNRVDRNVLDAARECGATAFALLQQILWPPNRRLFTFTATVLFCGSVGSFLEPRLLGTGGFEQASEWLQRALESDTGWPYAAVMLLLMLLLACLPLFVVALAKRRGQEIRL
ncbi:MAG: ABC transporter permease subunit [Rhodospirillaceae bacterium]|nr:ABC transporter permease subunit [Rhodospirillaceae bacterium]